MCFLPLVCKPSSLRAVHINIPSHTDCPMIESRLAYGEDEEKELPELWAYGLSWVRADDDDVMRNNRRVWFATASQPAFAGSFYLADSRNRHRCCLTGSFCYALTDTVRMRTTFWMLCMKRSFSTVGEDTGGTEINLWAKEWVTGHTRNRWNKEFWDESWGWRLYATDSTKARFGCHLIGLNLNKPNSLFSFCPIS